MGSLLVCLDEQGVGELHVLLRPMINAMTIFGALLRPSRMGSAILSRATAVHELPLQRRNRLAYRPGARGLALLLDGRVSFMLHSGLRTRNV